MVVVFEDATTRGQAVEVCDHLVERFWTDCDLAVSWLSCEMLGEPALARDALQKAAEADLLIFAVGSQEEVPLPVREWIETWLSLRGEREGALMDLFGKETEAEEAPAARHGYLRRVAHRGGMDYLSREPQMLSLSFSDSLDWYSARAERVSSVLDEILHTRGAPPQMVIGSCPRVTD